MGARKFVLPELRDVVAFHGRIPLDDVPAAIAAADIGLAPTRSDAFTEMSLSTKIFEYGAMGRPVVASRLPLVERAFPVGGPWTYEPGDADGLARAITEIVDEPAERARRVVAMRSAVEAQSWEVESARYLEIVDRMTGRPAGRRGDPG